MCVLPSVECFERSITSRFHFTVCPETFAGQLMRLPFVSICVGSRCFSGIAFSMSELLERAFPIWKAASLSEAATQLVARFWFVSQGQ